MAKIILCIFNTIFFSCADTPLKTEATIIPQAEKCVTDGASVYLRCADGREKIIELGYGTFMLMEHGKTSEALKFCGEQPVELDVNVKNAHIDHKELKTNGAMVLHEKTIISGCVETKCIKDSTIEAMKDFQKLRVVVSAQFH